MTPATAFGGGIIQQRPPPLNSLHPHTQSVTARSATPLTSLPLPSPPLDGAVEHATRFSSSFVPVPTASVQPQQQPQPQAQFEWLVRPLNDALCPQSKSSEDCLVEWSDCKTPAEEKEPSKQGRFVRSATVGGASYRGNVHFHGFTFEGQDYRIGDAILMHTSDDPDDAWLAELHKAWEERLPKNSKTPHLNRRLISVKWFYTRDDIKTHERTTGIPLDSSSLLLLNTVGGKDRGKGAEVLHSEHIQKELEIDCIEGLKSALVDQCTYSRVPPEPNTRHFVCRYNFDHHTNRISKRSSPLITWVITDDDDEDEDHDDDDDDEDDDDDDDNNGNLHGKEYPRDAADHRKNV